MGATWERARSAADQRVWAQILVPVADELEADATALSLAALAHMREQLPELFADPESAEENRASTEASIRTFAALVREGSDPRDAELPAATAAYAQAGVRRGVSLAALMRSYRLGVEVSWQAIFDRIATNSSDHAQLTAASRLGSAWLFAYVDVAMSLAERFYDDERARWLRSAAASQAETIDALVDGRERDASHASARLRYELDRHHLAAVAWLDAADEGEPLAYVEAAVAELARAAGADGVLVQPLGLLAVAAWLNRVTPFDALALDDLRLDPGVAPGVRVAIGEPGAGIAGFRASHTEASHARRVAALAGRRPGTVTRFGRVALSAMATVDLDLAQAFVARELGPLCENDDVARRLAATVRAYLDQNASRSRAAKQLGIHENTVSYRVRQAEELLGRRVDEHTLELRVALALLRVVRAD